MGIRQIKPPNVFRFDSYRGFFRAWFDYHRQIDPKFSLRKFSQKCEFASGYLPSVMSAKSGMSREAFDLTCKNSGITGPNYDFLVLLFTLSESQSRDEKVEALDEIRRILKRKSLPVDHLESYRYLSKWYHVAIREMVGLKEFKLDPKWIQKQLKYRVPIDEIRKSIKFLTKNGFITVSDAESPSLSKEPISCEGDLYKIAIDEFYGQIFDLEKKSFTEVEKSKRDINSYTVACTNDQFSKIRQILEKAYNDVVEVANDKTDAESVYQITLGLFPLAELQKKSGEKGQ